MLFLMCGLRWKFFRNFGRAFLLVLSHKKGYNKEDTQNK